MKNLKICLTKDLRKLLQAFLNSQAVKDALNQSKSPLAAITVLKKICVHPNLLSERAVDAVAKGGDQILPFYVKNIDLIMRQMRHAGISLLSCICFWIVPKTS